MQTLLVTGHSGFIGSNLIQKLSKKYKIIGLGLEKLENTKILQIKKDIRKINQAKLPKKISGIVHLAAITDVDFCQNNPTKCFDVNVQGTQNLLEISRKKNYKFLFLSTGHVFGQPKYLPINEDHPKNPTSIYAASKLAGEKLCASYSKSYGMDISVVRLFSIYGPRSPSHLVTTKIINQLLTKKSIQLGNQSSKRDFLYIDDAINAISIVLKNQHGFNTYNVGFGKSYSIKELCQTLIKIANKKVIVKTKKTTLRKNDIPEFIADSKKLRNLGWKPKIILNDGLKLTYDWYKNSLSK